ncbi:MAG: prolyl oligopeptidase family serine peptidase [Lachnospiraceae bacterium]|nr:prolyl oligopeptidase family serine peptidase [Lachnospiraceae bacterium]
MVSSWKERIPEWDEPSPDNDEICAGFEHRAYKKNGITIPYRLFVPEGPVSKGLASGESADGGVPLILFLHGADVTGEDNEVHIRAHDIGAVYARPQWQAYRPSVIVAPQYNNRLHWSRPVVMENLISLMDELCEEYPFIDPKMKCVYGYSAGGIGALKIMKQNPGLFHRALILCAATPDDYLDELSATPFWLFHAVDDGIVSNRTYTMYGLNSYYGSRALYEAMKEKMGDDIRYTEYAEGELMEKYGVNPHCAWVPVAQDEEALRWLVS